MPKRKIPALIVNQWLDAWEKVEFSEEQLRSEPEPCFLLFSLEASELRRLVGIQRRSTTGARALDVGIQRGHEVTRSREIGDYVRNGFPWSGLSQTKRESPDFQDIKNPGWLPTAIIVNILLNGDNRRGRTVHTDDLITVELNKEDGTALIELPRSDDSAWDLSGDLPPLEVIDGQHRLWAFEGNDDQFSGYELPVVAFYGLDISWQAYLFYTINIKPKRINSSLAFDLYPLLRTEDWLERFDDTIYKTTRSQELTEALWGHPKSPWYKRIDMLGQQRKMVTQNSWVRNLQTTFVKSWEGPRVQIGGLFGAPAGENKLVLPWSRSQQAAFLIYAWNELRKEISNSDYDWIMHLRRGVSIPPDLAFEGNETMLNSDMGVRGFLYILNDLCFVQTDELHLHRWIRDPGSATSETDVTNALDSLKDQRVSEYVGDIAKALATYDWRSSKAVGLSERERQAKARFRGGTGYKELRVDLLRHLSYYNSELAAIVQVVVKRLSYDL